MPRKSVASVVDPAPYGLRAAPRRAGARRCRGGVAALSSSLLVPARRTDAPGLDGAVGEASAPGSGHHARLVVAQDVAEALALGAGAERVVEGEEQGLGPLERRPAGRAARTARRSGAHRAAGRPAGSPPRPGRRPRARPVSKDSARRVCGIGARARRGRGPRRSSRARPGRGPGGGGQQVEHVVAHLDPREAAGDQPGRAGPPTRSAGGHRQREADQRAGAGVLGEQGVGHAIRRRASRPAAPQRGQWTRPILA